MEIMCQKDECRCNTCEECVELAWENSNIGIPALENQHDAVKELFKYIKEHKNKGNETTEKVNRLLKIANELNVIFKKEV